MYGLIPYVYKCIHCTLDSYSDSLFSLSLCLSPPKLHLFSLSLLRLLRFLVVASIARRPGIVVIPLDGKNTP